MFWVEILNGWRLVTQQNVTDKGMEAGRAGLELGWDQAGLEQSWASDKAGNKAWLGILFILKLLREEERKERNNSGREEHPS